MRHGGIIAELMISGMSLVELLSELLAWYHDELQLDQIPGHARYNRT